MEEVKEQSLSHIDPLPLNLDAAQQKEHRDAAGFDVWNLRIPSTQLVDCTKQSLRDMACYVDGVTWSRTLDDQWVAAQLSTTTFSSDAAVKDIMDQNEWCALGNMAFVAIHAREVSARKFARDWLARAKPSWGTEWDGIECPV